MSGRLAVGRTLDRYTIEQHLGQGGMATVVRVRHNVLGTVHAMKVLHLSTPRLIHRFLREGRVQASIRHPNLVGVTDVISLDHGVALILEYVDGPTLADLLRLFRPTVEELDELARQVMEGVASAHAKGVVHRDLKPANVLVAPHADGLIAKVTDFGLARALVEGLGPDAKLTQSGVPMGTPGYMAPEQFRSARDVDLRADVFSLGALLYELVTGSPAFDGPNLMSVYELMIMGRFTPVERLCPDVPARFGRAIGAALQPEPDDRPRDIEAFRALWLDGVPVARCVWEPEHLASVQRWIHGRAAQMARTPELDEALTPALTTASSEPLTRLGLPPSLLPPDATDQTDTPQRTAGAGISLAALAVAAAWGISLHLSAPPAPGPAPVGPSTVALAPLHQAEPVEIDEAKALPAAPLPVPLAAEPDPTQHKGRAASLATVRVTGVDTAILVGADGTRYDASKPVPAGTYRLLIQDKNGEFVQMMRRTFKSGERATIVCNPLMAVCR